MQETINRQISEQIEGKTRVEVIFPDVEWDFLSLYAQVRDDKEVFFIKPAFCRAKEIDKSVYEELCSQFTGEQKFNTDREIIRTKLSYDAFYNNYYNNLKTAAKKALSK